MPKATLILGSTYYLGNKRFEAGKAVAVTADEAKILSEKVVNFTGSNGNETINIPKPRFAITGDEEAAGEAKAAAGRSRKKKEGDEGDEGDGK